MLVRSFVTFETSADFALKPVFTLIFLALTYFQISCSLMPPATRRACQHGQGIASAGETVTVRTIATSRATCLNHPLDLRPKGFQPVLDNLDFGFCAIEPDHYGRPRIDRRGIAATNARTIRASVISNASILDEAINIEIARQEDHDMPCRIARIEFELPRRDLDLRPDRDVRSSQRLIRPVIGDDGEYLVAHDFRWIGPIGVGLAAATDLRLVRL